MRHLSQAYYLDSRDRTLSSAASFAGRVKTLSTAFEPVKVSNVDYTTLPEDEKSKCLDHLWNEGRMRVATRYAKRTLCLGHWQMISGGTVPTSTILDSTWLQLKKSSLTQSSGGHSDTPQLNLPRVVACSQLLVAVSQRSDWPRNKPPSRLRLLYTRSWRGGLIIRVRWVGRKAVKLKMEGWIPTRTIGAA